MENDNYTGDRKIANVVSDIFAFFVSSVFQVLPVSADEITSSRVEGMKPCGTHPQDSFPVNTSVIDHIVDNADIAIEAVSLSIPVMGHTFIVVICPFFIHRFGQRHSQRTRFATSSPVCHGRIRRPDMKLQYVLNQEKSEQNTHHIKPGVAVSTSHCVLIAHLSSTDDERVIMLLWVKEFWDAAEDDMRAASVHSDKWAKHPSGAAT